MKLWDKGFSTDKKIDIFTVGTDRELDLLIAKYDVIASTAHAEMLESIGLLSKEECTALVAELEVIGTSIENGDFVIEDEFEDVHSKIEFMLTEKLGDTGKRIHTARSRNDQVLVAIHLYLKDELLLIKDAVHNLFGALIKLADKYKDNLLPGYTHLQIAMPSSFGLWFSSYAETLIDDMYFVKAALKVVDQNPLGSAAGYGSSFPINRELTTKKMGFSQMKYNVVAAQMSRGKAERSMAMALSSVASTVAKFSMDVCLYMSQNFDFLTFPDELTTGSSIMPHKKNPDVFELIRGKCNKVQSVQNQLALLTNNLPSGYHRDLQLTKEILIPAISDLKSSLEMCTFSIENVIIKQDILKDPKYDYLFSVDTLNKLVLDGMSFRDAYKKIGMDIMNGNYVPNKVVSHSHEGSIGNLCLDKIVEKMKDADPEI